MIKYHLSEDEISNSFTHKWLEDLNNRTIQKLGKTPAKAKDELIVFIKKKNIKTSNPEKLAQLIITLWTRHKLAVDMIESPEFKKERRKLESNINRTKQLIEQINKTKQTCAIPYMLNLDLNISFDYDALTKANQEYIDYLELSLRQYFGRGTCSTGKDKIQELAIFTMFYIGEELLNLKKIGKPSPLFSFIKILLNIHDNSNTGILGEDKLSKYYKNYRAELRVCLETPFVSGKRLNTNYSITTYQDGWLVQIQNGNEKREYFVPCETHEGVVRLLNFIYRRNIPDHKITMGLFDIEILSEIINLTI
ncbi:hypothetical protein [Legionella israelensis]|nr:hypothetical protein [Legionella israelensis]QBS08732.1 hypothetical protein E4T55_01985 [Legionella israelensis]